MDPQEGQGPLTPANLQGTDNFNPQPGQAKMIGCSPTPAAWMGAEDTGPFNAGRLAKFKP